MALFGASVLVLLIFIYWSTAATMARQADATIEAEVKGLQERYRLTGLSGLRNSITERISRRPADSSIYLLVDRNFFPLVGNIDQWPGVEVDQEGWLDFRLEGVSKDESLSHRARARRFQLRGGFYLLVGRDIHELEETQRLIVRTLGWGLAITLVLALAGGSLMTRSMVRRIETINDTSGEIMSGDLARRIPTDGSGDDFDQLTERLNSMLDRIQASMDDVRRVSDNIAHDLRTPLARLRNKLEQMKNALAEGGPERTLAEEAVAEADALLATFKSLLRIARVESGERRAGFAQLDMSRLLQDVAELYEPVIEECGHKLSIDIEPSVQVNGDRDLLFQAIANLLDNAAKYTPPSGLIELKLHCKSGQAQIGVTDNGPGIPESLHDTVLQRFFRMEESRTTPGNGLGLSLVAAVAQIHDAELRLQDNGPGLRAILRLPAVSSE
ncbi:MAG: two-component sensor histidine kinase [Gammaproteobacteria bacterium]|nr:MAG: two-component sensor histidine kinase [Gammaproteobacteria bacterium]